MAEFKRQPLPSNLDQSLSPFVQNVEDKLAGPQGAEFSVSTYGHAAGNLANMMIAWASLDKSPEFQREKSRLAVIKIITRYGKGIIPLLSQELKLALDGVDVESLIL